MILIINSFDSTAKLYDDFSFRLEKSYRSPRAINWDEISGIGIIVPSLTNGLGILKVDDPGRDTNYFAKRLLSKIPSDSVSVFYIDGNAVLRNIPFEDSEPRFERPLGLIHQELLQAGLAKSGLNLHDAQVITGVLENEFSLVAWNKGAPIELVSKQLFSESLSALLKPKLRQNPRISLKLKHYLKELTFGVGGLMLYSGRIDGVFLSGPLADSPNLVREGLIMSLRAFPTTHVVTAEVDPSADAARMVSQLL